MKHSMIRLYFLALFLATILSSCAKQPFPSENDMGFHDNPSAKLEESLREYNNIMLGDPPEDLRLTIYYINSDIYTLAPLSVESLIASCSDKIVVGAEGLVPHWKSMQEIDLSAIKPTSKGQMNARLYYVLETGISHKLLEVVFYGVSEKEVTNVFVNGLAVEYDHQLVEMIEPFLETSKWSFGTPEGHGGGLREP